MKKTILQWQNLLAQAANQKFPNNSNWSQYDRIASIQRQLDDVLNAVRVEDGLLQSKHHAHKDVDHRIAALIADVLILADERDVDVEKELENVLRWFTTPLNRH